MRNTLVKLFPWRRLIVVLVVLPLIGVLVVLAFAWPVARIGPRGLPVGVVGAGPVTQQAGAGLTRSEPGGFSIGRYAGQAAARSAIEHRDIYGAFVIAPGRLTVLEAGAASPAVAQLLTAVGQQLASHPPAPAAATAQPRPAIQVRSVDVVATSASDPRGLILLAVAAPTAGLIALFGPAGLAAGAGLMIVVGDARRTGAVICPDAVHRSSPLCRRYQSAPFSGRPSASTNGRLNSPGAREFPGQVPNPYPKGG